MTNITLQEDERRKNNQTCKTIVGIWYAANSYLFPDIKLIDGCKHFTEMHSPGREIVSPSLNFIPASSQYLPDPNQKNKLLTKIV